MGKKLLHITVVILIVVVFTLNLIILQGPPTTEDTPIIGEGNSRAGSPPVLRAGINSPHEITIDEDEFFELDLHTNIFRDPENEPIYSNMVGGGTDGHVSNSFLDAWIVDQRHLNIQPVRDIYTQGTPAIFKVSCTDLGGDIELQINITITQVNDTYQDMDEDATKTINLVSTTFASWPYTITACTINEAQLGEYKQTMESNDIILFIASIESSTTLKIVPGKDLIGTGWFNVSATDGTHSTTTEFHMTVNNVNDLPRWVSVQKTRPKADDEPRPIVDGANMELKVFEDSWQEYNVTAYDVDGDTMSYSSSMAETYDRFVIEPSTGLFEFSPIQEDIGYKTYEKHMFITLYCNDGQTTESIETQVEFIIYNINDQPVNNNFTLTYETLNWRTVTFTAMAGTDKDGDDLKYEWNFGDESGLVKTEERTIEHVYPDTYKGGTYNASMRVSDGHEGSYSSWIYQVVTVARPKVDDYEVNIDVNPKVTQEMEYLIDKADVVDEGIQGYATDDDDYMKALRTINLKGHISPIPKRLYVYEEVADGDYELMKDMDDEEIIIDSVVMGDWEVYVERNVSISPDTSTVFKYALASWTEYGYDIHYFQANYYKNLVTIDDPKSVSVDNNMEGSSDLDIEIESVQVTDRTESKQGPIHTVTRTIMISGTCDTSEIHRIIFYESEG